MLKSSFSTFSDRVGVEPSQFYLHLPLAHLKSQNPLFKSLFALSPWISGPRHSSPAHVNYK